MQTTERATRVAMGRIDAMRPDNQLIIKPTRAVRLTSQIDAVLAALRRKNIYSRCCSTNNGIGVEMSPRCDAM